MMKINVVSGLISSFTLVFKDFVEDTNFLKTADVTHKLVPLYLSLT